MYMDSNTVTSATLFHANPTSGVPIYRQLMEQVVRLAASGRLRPGELLPSVRQVSQELAINPMTVSKAYSALERDGVVEFVRGTGMRLRAVTVPEDPAARLAHLAPLLHDLAARARQLALPPAVVLAALTPLLEEPR